MFDRNEFTLCLENFLESTIIPNNEICICQSILQLFLTDEQGLRGCDCLKICIKHRLSSDPKMYCATVDATTVKPAQINNYSKYYYSQFIVTI